MRVLAPRSTYVAGTSHCYIILTRRFARRSFSDNAAKFAEMNTGVAGVSTDSVSFQCIVGVTKIDPHNY